MKTRFNTFDLMCTVTELQRLVGMRVAQVYDIDHKTYLLKLQRTEEKSVLLIESGNRIHTTGFEWPKNVAPSGFSMKMRKHLRNKRLESLNQLGIDRVVDMQFGSGEAAYHIILELYDRGNIILTDCNLVILNVLRPHTEGEEVRFAVREKYPLDRARQRKAPSEEEIAAILSEAKQGDSIKNIFNRHTEYGPAVLEHVLLSVGLAANCKLGKNFSITEDTARLMTALQNAEVLFDSALAVPSKGYIIQKRETRPQPDGTEADFFSNQEFHPVVFLQHAKQPHREFESFDAAVDEFFSTLESQKIDMKALHQEREALKKLENVRKDHSQRLETLQQTQQVDRRRAELITSNQKLVDQVLTAMRALVASQASWPEIEKTVQEAQESGDPVASTVHELKLSVNHVSLLLSDPFADDDADEEGGDASSRKSMVVDIDLDLTAFANARKYYDQKRTAAKKQQKTLESQQKAFKSAEKKTKQTLKEVQAISHISKLRKVYWFEKFHWFISSENYLVIGGRDPQQNELIVKRYLRPGDLYVHADIQGASSIVIKNPSGLPVPPKTLNEAGAMAISYSVAWEAKVVTSAWWVHHDQVSKTAPTGEYLTTGAFMIRGKKNYLPPSHLIMGFTFVFKLEDSSIERHKDDRRVRTLDEDVSSVSTSVDGVSVSEQDEDQEVELEGTDDETDEGETGGAGDKVRASGEVERLAPVAEVANRSNQESPENASSAASSRDSSPAPEGVGRSGDGERQTSQGSSERKVEFPDVELRFQLGSEGIKLEAPATALRLSQSSPDPKDEKVVFLGDDKPVIVGPALGPSRKAQNRAKQGKAPKKTQEKVTAAKNEKNIQEQQTTTQQQQQQMKRGQRGKLKKMKEKYKFQDEEDRQVMMAMLKPGGSDVKETRKKKSKEAPTQRVRGGPARGPGEGGRGRLPRPPPAAQPGEAGDESEGEGEEERGPAVEMDMLDSLTGQPVAEDELLFAVPVVAPYATLHSYKFKVKLTPGTGKRGKAAKTALNMFLKDRSTTARERDLIRSVKDEDLARNLPGKVKLSAPQMQRLRR